MAFWSRSSKITICFYITILTAMFVFCEICLAEGKPTLVVKTYTREVIPFERHEVDSTKDGAKIIVAEYGSITTVVYPAPKETIPQDEKAIIRKCRESLEKNIDDILKVQNENGRVKYYLTINSSISAFNKKDYLNLVDSPAEKNIQIDPKTKKVTAEFRSKEFPIDEDRSFCVYITFIYDPGIERIEEIVLSVEGLISV